MGGVDVVPWGPTEDDELAVLDRFFYAEPGMEATGRYSFRIGSLAPNTVAAVLNEANKHIGVSGRPNIFTREYASRHGSEFLSVAWCDIFQTYLSRHTPAPAMTPHGDRAYTPWHAHDFEQVGQAYAGTIANIKAHAVPGSVGFCDWKGSNLAPNVDHVFLTVRNLGDGRLVTLEGNTSDRVALRVRAADVIATFGVPAYVAPPKPTPKPSTKGDPWPYKAGTLMRKGWMSSAGVMKVQARINSLGYLPKLAVDGDFGTKTEKGVMWAQRKYKIDDDGVVGPITWGRLFA